MTVRCAFTSDLAMDWHGLPEDLRFTAAFGTSQARVLWLPEEPASEDAMLAPRPRRPTSPRPTVPQLCAPQRRPLQPQKKNEAVVEAACQHMQLQPNPVAEPRRVSAFSGAHPGLLHWVLGSDDGSSSGGGAGEEIVFAAGPLIVAMQPSAGGQQRYLQGHMRAVHALALTASGHLASAEEGTGPPLRLWDLRQGRCLATVPGEGGWVGHGSPARLTPSPCPALMPVPLPSHMTLCRPRWRHYVPGTEA